MNLFGDCVRTMLYIDMSIVSASGVTGLCAAGGVKSAAGLRACAVIGGPYWSSCYSPFHGTNGNRHQ
jgi:hypothetical protein